MQSLREPPAWNKDAVDLLNQFLGTPVGQIFLATLASRRPGLSTSSWRSEAVALQAKKAEGYEACIQEILRLTEPVKEEKPGQTSVSTNYPDLEDDSLWDDDKQPPTQ